jgi:hypothetical protein
MRIILSYLFLVLRDKINNVLKTETDADETDEKRKNTWL